MMVHHLPHEIIREILSRIPFEYVIQCKQVCKTWRNLLRHIKRDKNKNLLFKGKYNYDHLMQLYLGEYDEKSNKKLDEKLSYNALTPVGCPCINIESYSVSSHRGLVCLLETNNSVNDDIYICNPFTQETVLLPKLALPRGVGNDLLVSGFGYHYATNKYKIVGIYYEVNSGFSKGQVHVYTLGDKNGWINKGITDHCLRKSDGILSNGAIHWIANLGLEIVAFDLADEEFKSVPTPPCCLSDKYSYSQLQLLGGYLSIVVRGYSTGSNMDIWLLKGTKNKMHWCKEFTIHSKDFSPSHYHPFALTEENKILMRYNENTLCHYDPKTATLKKFVKDKRFRNTQVIPYMKSDVSLAVLLADLQVVNWASMSRSLGAQGSGRRRAQGSGRRRYILRTRVIEPSDLPVVNRASTSSSLGAQGSGRRRYILGTGVIEPSDLPVVNRASMSSSLGAQESGRRCYILGTGVIEPSDLPVVDRANMSSSLGAQGSGRRRYILGTGVIEPSDLPVVDRANMSSSLGAQGSGRRRYILGTGVIEPSDLPVVDRASMSSSLGAQGSGRRRYILGTGVIEPSDSDLPVVDRASMTSSLGAQGSGCRFLIRPTPID